jgi:hypothetical protein
MIVRALGDDNTTLEQRDRVTIDSIRNHTYRDILERRAKENSVDFIEGVASAITPPAVPITLDAQPTTGKARSTKA